MIGNSCKMILRYSSNCLTADVGETSLEGRRQKVAGTLLWVCLFVLLGAFYWPSLKLHIEASRTRFNDDVCQHISPFLRPLGNGKRDYIDRYCLAYLPEGYRLLYAEGAKLLNPRLISRLLPYFLLFITAGALALAAWRFAGAGGAWVAVALTLSADVFLERMAGGLPRSFAFPFFAVAAAAAIWGRIYILSAMTVLSAAFYPSIAVPCGITLFFLMILPQEDRGMAAAWSLRKRALMLITTALLTVMVVLPVIHALKPYGPLISSSDLANYPEAGKGGRLGANDRIDYNVNWLSGVRIFAAQAFYNSGKPWSVKLRALIKHTVVARTLSIIGWVLIIFGMLVGGRRDPAIRRLLVLTLAALAAFLLAKAGSPYLFLPQRQLQYPIPILALLWFIASLSLLAELCIARRSPDIQKRVRIFVVWLAGLAVLVTAGGHINNYIGLTVKINTHDHLCPFLASLPKNAYIAGWPNWMSPVPYLCAKPVYLSYETHLPFQKGYTKEMRRRMGLLIDAYFSSSLDPLLRLRNEEGVTHLVITRAYLNHPPFYFRPFHKHILRAYAHGKKEGFAVLRLRSKAEVYADNRVFVLDLRRL